MQHEGYLSLGSNMGDRAGNCLKAIEILGKIKETKLVSQSSLYETAPIGYEDQAPFINMAVKIITAMNAPGLLSHIKAIEKSLGRVRTFKWGPRLIDIDILFFDDEIISGPGLKVPHPAMEDRAFVLLPLAEIGSEFIHPLKKTSVAQMAKEVPRKESVKRITV
ncbi:MAG: 2-amino-4-hydroxy-6-hydroxymethyldihydropteridine diphosphokinase [Deltaproteobacteria bacterium]|nr:2-amino-4-hydroxy-6-hydroxymethyldihydropteridine diphosphokinase [Deltaproteobacteria bacterium]